MFIDHWKSNFLQKVILFPVASVDAVGAVDVGESSAGEELHLKEFVVLGPFLDVFSVLHNNSMQVGVCHDVLLKHIFVGGPVTADDNVGVLIERGAFYGYYTNAVFN